MHTRKVGQRWGCRGLWRATKKLVNHAHQIEPAFRAVGEVQRCATAGGAGEKKNSKEEC